MGSIVYTIELLLVGALALIAFYAITSSAGVDSAHFGQLADPSIGAGPMALAIAGLLALYFFLRIFWKPHATFWLLALAVLLFQIPAIISDARLDWVYIFTGEKLFEGSLSSIATTSLFTGSLALLVVLHRAIALRDRYSNLRRQGAAGPEGRTLLLGELLSSVAITTGSLLLALGLLALATVAGGFDWLYNRSPWTVLTVGAGATTVLAGFLFLCTSGAQGRREISPGPRLTSLLRRVRNAGGTRGRSD